jgi:hypothetical protein
MVRMKKWVAGILAAVLASVIAGVIVYRLNNPPNPSTSDLADRLKAVRNTCSDYVSVVMGVPSGQPVGKLKESEYQPVRQAVYRLAESEQGLELHAAMLQLSSDSGNTNEVIQKDCEAIRVAVQHRLSELGQ